jgi:hypothetical protein
VSWYPISTASAPPSSATIWGLEEGVNLLRHSTRAGQFKINPRAGSASAQGSTDAPGLWSRSGVAHQYAKEIAGGNETVNSFFTGVITAVVQQYLDASGIGGDAGQAIIDTFFESGAAGLRHSF